MNQVVIVQEYVPAYRAPFFSFLRCAASKAGIDVIVAAGTPNLSQAMRRDTAKVDGIRSIAQHERYMFGRRFNIRDLRPAIKGAEFIVLEQARRNLDAYRMLGHHKSGRRVALWGHGRDYTHAPGSLDRAAYNWLTKRADWFFAYTSGGKDAVRVLGYPSNRVTVVQNSIDTLALAHAVAAVDAASAAEFANTHDLRGKTALFMGGLDESKRLPLLLEAAHRIANQDPEFRLLIAGAGKQLNYILDAARRSPWLRYLGSTSGSLKALALASSQVIAMPGRVGLIAVDSFAAGIPVVTTDWPWHAPEFEYLRDGVNAVISHNSLDDYTSALCTVLNDPARLSRLGTAAADNRRRYTIEAMVQNYLGGIQRWLGSGRRR